VPNIFFLVFVQLEATCFAEGCRLPGKVSKS
jgi:hypothetical protein